MTDINATRRTNKNRDGLCVVCLPDIHAPYHDPQTVNVATQITRDLRPDVLIFLGDLFDFYDLSSFDKNPDRQYRLQDEFDVGRELVQDICYKQTRERHLTQGNHEHRFERYLRRKAPELHGLRDLTFERLSGLENLHFDIHPYGDVINVGDLFFTHGERTSIHSSYATKRIFFDHMASIVHGHNHKIGMYAKTTLSGSYFSYEVGHLADPNPGYIKGMANWQQGFGVAWVDEESGEFWLDQVPIKDGRAMYRGSVWR